MTTDYQDLWVCPFCNATFALSNAKTFMIKESDGILDCPECHGAHFHAFERWSPKLTFMEDHGWVKLDNEGGIEDDPWACDTAMFRAWGWEFEQAVRDMDFQEIYLVGVIGPDWHVPCPQDHRDAKRKPGNSWGFIPGGDADVPYRCLAYTKWLEGFGPDVNRVWIRIEEEHYTQ